MPTTRRDTKDRHTLSFNRYPLSELRELVGERVADTLMPVLEAAANAYTSTRVVTARRSERRRRVARLKEQKAASMEHDARRLLLSMDAAQRVQWPYASDRPAGNSRLTLADLGRDVPATVVYSAERGWSLERTRWYVAGLATRTADWRRMMHLQSLAKRGRKQDIRLYLALWVGTKLGQSGTRLSKSRNGVFAQVLSIVYDLAKIDAPGFLYNDVAYVVGRLRGRTDLLK